MTKKTDFTFLSSDGKTRLHGIAWIPEDVTPVAVLQIVHGVAEYVGRYDDFASGRTLKVVLHHEDGSKESFEVQHTYNEQQIAWFRAGSALNAR